MSAFSQTDQRASLRVHHGSATGREHLRTVVEKACNDALLAGTKIRFAVLVENLGYGHARGAFDLGVGINERNSESAGKPSSDRRFASAHHADEHNRAAAERTDHRRFQAFFRRFLNGTVNHAMVPKRIHGSIYQ
jgi:biotin-(acetyl-CoA carboxylase) ligase